MRVLSINMENFDFVIIGAGLFGIYASLDLEKRGYKVLLLEKEIKPYSKASLINQARVHMGYHYPRSITTALSSRNFSERFIFEHKEFLNQSFISLYAIDKYGTLTNKEQFLRFTKFLNLYCEEIEIPHFFKSDRLETCFKVEECTFDPFLLREFYLSKLNNSKIIKLFNCNLESAYIDKNKWNIKLKEENKSEKFITTNNVVNATYSSINIVNEIFNLNSIKVENQLAEVVLVYSNSLSSYGLTVMDGPFVSIIPYGNSGLHSLTSVLYTHHNNFAKQKNYNFDNDFPKSNSKKMITQLKHYLSDKEKIYNHGSFYTIKTKLKKSHINDSRPTNIDKLTDNPGFYQLFSGKISSIYEFEELWK